MADPVILAGQSNALASQLWASNTIPYVAGTITTPAGGWSLVETASYMGNPVTGSPTPTFFGVKIADSSNNPDGWIVSYIKTGTAYAWQITPPCGIEYSVTSYALYASSGNPFFFTSGVYFTVDTSECEGPPDPPDDEDCYYKRDCLGLPSITNACLTLPTEYVFGSLSLPLNQCADDIGGEV